MKKITLSIVAILFTLAGYTQDFYKVTNISALESRNNQWTIVESKQITEDLYVIFDGNKIKVAGSNITFMCHGESKANENDDCKSYTWEAYDREGDDCTIVIVNCFNTNAPKTMAVTFAYLENGRAVKYDLEAK